LEARTYHIPVLLEEVLSYLLTSRNGLYVDGTIGGGGHTEALLRQLDFDGKVIGIDLDDDALTEVDNRLAYFGDRLIFIKENFRNIKTVLSKHGINTIQGGLLDLGVSSYQLDEPTKGFSFQEDGQLDMRMNRHQEINAKHIINQYDAQSLADIFWKYGEERNSRKIANAIIQHTNQNPFETTGQLATIIDRVTVKRFRNKTLARIFQAIRIEVNNEIENLRQALLDFIDVLSPGGRLVVISYHSLEDRLVKETFRKASARLSPSGNKIIPDIPIRPVLNILTKKPVKASSSEFAANPRSRSAKLRAAEKT
jgi:16S rRNA (cytosine1402-N4)-methyltransferase